jgi:hypothetical protein
MNPTYEQVRAEAQIRANETGCDQGIEKNKLFGTFRHFSLPGAQYRAGYELRCEVVHPDNIAETRAGHGHEATSQQVCGWHGVPR